MTTVACPTCHNDYTARKDGQPRKSPFLFQAHLRENRSGPRGARNTTEGLTHSLDLGKEGLA